MNNGGAVAGEHDSALSLPNHYNASQRFRPLILSLTMPSQTLVDQRGYVFSLPTLGLPDPAGEWISIGAAIGTKEKAIDFVRRGAFNEPRRYACDREALVVVEFEGAAWILPFCAPQTRTTLTAESFTLKVRRLPLIDASEYSRIKLPDGLALWCATHPKGLSFFEPPEYLRNKYSTASRPPIEADEQTFWHNIFTSPQQGAVGPKPLASGLLKVDWSSKLHSTSHPAAWQTCKDKRVDPVPMNWDYSPLEAFEPAWQNESLLQAINEARKLSKSPKIDHPALAVKAKTYKGGAEIAFLWAPTFGEKAPEPREDQWRPIPTRAWKKGHELRFVNQVRVNYGLTPIKQDELHLARAAASA